MGRRHIFFTNSANGTAWHLDVLPSALMAMSSNITAPQDSQRYSFTTLGAINDEAFSTVDVGNLNIDIISYSPLTPIHEDSSGNSYAYL